MLRALDRGDGELVEGLARQYQQDSSAQLANVQQALADSDAQMLGRAAHSLAGSSATLGATHLAELCAELEEVGRSGALVDAPDLVADATIELGQVQIVLRRLLVET